MKKRKRIGSTVGIVILVLGMAAGLFMLELKTTRRLAIGRVDLTAIDDGVYRGRSGFILRSNALAGTVSDHRITGIEILRDAMVPVEDTRKPVYTELFKTVIDRQTVDVDVVSGATVTTKQYLKSIENALSQ